MEQLQELKTEIDAAAEDLRIGRSLKDEDEMLRPSLTQDPDVLYEQLVQSILRYHPSHDMSQIRRAYDMALAAHNGQRRHSGEPYIIHPLHVAIILAELEMDKESIIGGLLHDIVEDTATTLEDVEAAFGRDVALIVDGVTKLTRLTLGTGDKLEMQAENLRKMFLSMAKDIRIIIVKLADRLHNMRTLDFMTPEKQKEKSTETLEIYAPLANRLGIFRVKMELDNLALSYLESEKYKKLVEDVEARSAARGDFIQSIVQDVNRILEENDLKAQVYGRVKHYFSIYKKMLLQNKTIDEIYDLFAVRVLVDNVSECYSVLGLIHELYTPIPGRFKDYIAMPKPNNYQSLHTTVIGKSGIPFEIQIRTFEMHRTAEYGVAAHWKYKEGKAGGESTKEEEKLNWLRQILEWQKDMPDNAEFMKTIKSDLNMFSESVYCFTPKGDVKNLPKGSTPIDLAYLIHTAVGNKTVGARANGKLVPIDYVIQNGDRIEIITSQNSKGPSRDWLKIVKSTQAKNKINGWFKEQNKEENIEKGREMLERYCRAKGLVLSDLLKHEYQEKVLRKYGFRDWNAVLASLGHGGIKEGQIVNKLVEEKKKDDQQHLTDEQVREIAEENGRRLLTRTTGGIVVEGLSDLAVHFSRCCSPIPGDEIVGFVTRGRGISIHRTDCINILNLPEAERSRLIQAEWQAAEGTEKAEKYICDLMVYGNNRIGLLADITRMLSEDNIDISFINTKVNKQKVVTMELQFMTAGTDESKRVMNKLMSIEGVVDVTRARS